VKNRTANDYVLIIHANRASAHSLELELYLVSPPSCIPTCVFRLPTSRVFEQRTSEFSEQLKTIFQSSVVLLPQNCRRRLPPTL
jgi:hypothetical protein